MAEDIVAPAMLAILQCIERNLTTPVAIATLSPGSNVVWDDCCQGELWVRVISIVGAGSMARPSLQPCALQFSVRLGIGVMRCAATIDDSGIPPNAAQMTADTMTTLQDRTDIMTGLICCVTELGLDALRIEDWTPQGVQGGCVGGEINVTFTIGGCSEC